MVVNVLISLSIKSATEIEHSAYRVFQGYIMMCKAGPK